MTGWVRLALAAALAIGVVVLLWALFMRPGQLKADAALQRAGAVVATGETNKAADARGITERTHETIRTIERQTVINERTIRAAPGAGDAISVDLDRAGRGALCLRYAYSADPACVQLPDPDSANVDGTDAGGDAASG